MCPIDYHNTNRRCRWGKGPLIRCATASNVPVLDRVTLLSVVLAGQGLHWLAYCVRLFKVPIMFRIPPDFAPWN